MKTKIKVYVPSCSEWFTVASLAFLPLPEKLNGLINQIVDLYCEDTMAGVSKVKVMVDGKVYKTIEY